MSVKDMAVACPPPCERADEATRLRGPSRRPVRIWQEKIGLKIWLGVDLALVQFSLATAVDHDISVSSCPFNGLTQTLKTAAGGPCCRESRDNSACSSPASVHPSGEGEGPAAPRAPRPGSATPAPISKGGSRAQPWSGVEGAESPFAGTRGVMLTRKRRHGISIDFNRQGVVDCCSRVAPPPSSVAVPCAERRLSNWSRASDRV